MKLETELNIALTEFFRPIVAQCVQEAIRELSAVSAPTNSTTQTDPYGDFKWLQSTCVGIPASTLRIKSASGEIPGVVKFGKRVLYEKAIVLSWLRSHTRQPSNAALTDQQAEEQFKRQLSRRGGVRA